MASREEHPEELRLALRQALRARQFDLKSCLARARSLRMAGLDPIADMDLARWMGALRQVDPASTVAQRARLVASLDRMALGGREIAIRKRGSRLEAATQVR